MQKDIFKQKRYLILSDYIIDEKKLIEHLKYWIENWKNINERLFFERINQYEILLHGIERGEFYKYD